MPAGMDILVPKQLLEDAMEALAGARDYFQSRSAAKAVEARAEVPTMTPLEEECGGMVEQIDIFLRPTFPGPEGTR